MTVCLRAAFSPCALSCLDNHFAPQPPSRAFHISASFHGIRTKAASTAAAFSGSAPKQVCISCMCGSHLWCSNRGCVLSSHTVFMSSRVPFRAENIIYYAEQTISNQQMASCSSMCTVCSLAKAGQVKRAACASLYVSQFFLIHQYLLGREGDHILLSIP